MGSKSWVREKGKRSLRGQNRRQLSQIPFPLTFRFETPEHPSESPGHVGLRLVKPRCLEVKVEVRVELTV